jgi:hypothetical protein
MVRARRKTDLVIEKGTMMSSPLSDYSLFHAGRKPVMHPELGVEIVGQTAVRYYRFCRPVSIDRLEWPITMAHGGTPRVPLHPAHLLVSILNPRTMRWETIKEADLPPNPRIMGKGLNQGMSIEKMTAFFEKVMKEPPYVIPLRIPRTDHLRMECDREYPGWPNHQEFDGGCFNVPFSAFDQMKVFGRDRGKTPAEFPYFPVLRKGTIRPRPPKGMKIAERPFMIRYEGPRFSVGFSTRRPMLTHLGWDYFERGHAGENRMLATNAASFNLAAMGGFSGPMVHTFHRDALAHHWTGEISVVGNRVIYSNLHAVDGLRVDAEFIINPEGLILKLHQQCNRDIPVIEGETWRFAWDMRNGLTGTAGMPTNLPGRNGDLHWPVMFTGDGIGCLSAQVLEGNVAQTRMQAESYRFQSCRSAGIILAPRPEADQPLYFPAGKREAVIEIAVSNLEPQTTKPASAQSEGVKTAWSSVFTTFRPEHGGFSNNAVSNYCHVNQMGVIDIAARTNKPLIGPDPLHLAKYSIERTLLDGGGYGYYRNLYLDSDPNLVCGAGRIFQVIRDRAWIERIKPGLIEATRRMLGTFGKEGLAICRDLSGNTGSFRWSSNAMDVVGFGHIDGYVNALTYRALRNAAALLKAVGETDLATRSNEGADRILTHYANILINPKTGWVSAWKSRDGKLHDHASLFVNSVALAFGLLKKPAAVKALKGLERLRAKVGMESGMMGLPHNLLPIESGDHMLPKLWNRLMPTFENYTDGSLSTYSAGFYLRALSLYGLKKDAKKLAGELDRGYAENVFHGKFGQGSEFHTWDGMDSGYEGTFGPSFNTLYAVAVEKGILKPLAPEWWPE